MGRSMAHKFGPTPEIVITRGASQLISGPDEARTYLDRHFSGDWGEISEGDAEQNDAMIKEEGMILSSYNIPGGQRIWVITDPGHRITTILLPEEY